MYLMFIPLGLVGDLFLGLYLIELWYYNYSLLIEYIFLYLWIYPVGGIVMVQSYIYLTNAFNSKKILTPNPPPKIDTAKILKSCIIFLFLSLLVAVLGNIFDIKYYLQLFFVTNSIFLTLLINYVSEKINSKSLIRDIFNRPKLTAIAFIGGTYINAIFHELPNTHAWQWVYTNIPLSSISIFKVPVFVFLGWPILMLVPLSLYYLSSSSHSDTDGQRFKTDLK